MSLILIVSTGTTVSFSHAFERFFDVFAAARPGSFLAEIAGDF